MAGEDLTIQEKRSSAAKANRKWRQHISAICREYTKDAVTCLVEIMNDANGHTPSRVRAATEILNRGWGTSPVNIKVDSGGETDLSKAGDAELLAIIAEQQQALESINDVAEMEYDEDEDEDEEEGADDEVPMPGKKVH